MNSQQAELYQRIQRFSLDRSDAHLPFSKRLARDNGWTVEYSQRVIDEYKKFAFLAIAAGHPVTPSDQVDQAWHLHLTYTRSYWDEFCAQVLQTSLDHEPTRGGSNEQSKFDCWYAKTLESYEHFFEQPPPAEIWPRAELRFGRDIHFVRVNTQQNWILSKFVVKNSVIALVTLVLAIAIVGCTPLIIDSIPNPLNFKGSEFLEFYILLGTTIIICATLLRWYLRQPAKNPFAETVSLDTYETAYLVEGAVVEAVGIKTLESHLQPTKNLLYS
jgi:hypothetical protein